MAADIDFGLEIAFFCMRSNSLNIFLILFQQKHEDGGVLGDHKAGHCNR